MLTRREFVQAAGVASLAMASTECEAACDSTSTQIESRRSRCVREPTYLGGHARYWLGRLLNRSVLEYNHLDELNNTSRDQIYEAVAAFGQLVVPDLRRMLFRRPDQGRSDALRVFSRMGTLGEAVLIEAARDPRGYLRTEALLALAHGFP